jgi:hypothetical protein
MRQGAKHILRKLQRKKGKEGQRMKRVENNNNEFMESVINNCSNQ